MLARKPGWQRAGSENNCHVCGTSQTFSPMWNARSGGAGAISRPWHIAQGGYVVPRQARLSVVHTISVVSVVFTVSRVCGETCPYSTHIWPSKALVSPPEKTSVCREHVGAASGTAVAQQLPAKQLPPCLPGKKNRLGAARNKHGYSWQTREAMWRVEFRHPQVMLPATWL